ncbi:MAG: hypothetical protein PWP65_1910 [Clostridia bacterium]|nr:hypothetical protein [Clostridia bacterium]
MRRRWRRPGPHPGAKLLVAGLCLLLCLLFLEWRLRTALETVAAAQARWAATEAIQKAVLEKICTQISYSDLIKPNEDTGRQVLFMQANVLQVSRMQAEAQLAIQAALEELKRRKSYLPLGVILGPKLLAAYGPSIPLTFIPIGAVDVAVADSFQAAGINQTRHRIYLQVSSNIRIVAPFIGKDVEVRSQVPLAEAIIVGPVPQTYLSIGMEVPRGILRAPEF